jgi:hypothetical protein
MSSDDLVSRVHQQAQGEREAEVHQAVALFSAWRDAAHRLLAGTRYNLPAIVASSEELLEPLSIKHIREVGKRRKRRRWSKLKPPSAGSWATGTGTAVGIMINIYTADTIFSMTDDW